MTRAHSGLKCGNCGAPVDTGEPVCSSCGARLVRALCERCGYRGPREEFQFNRCPACGHRSDIGSKFLGPLMIVAVVVVLMVLSFLMAR